MADATTDPAETNAALISNAIALKKLIAEKADELKKLEKQILALGAGKHAGHGQDVINVIPAASGTLGRVEYFWPRWETPEEGKAIEAKIRELAGDRKNFAKLFVREVNYFPCDGFAAVAPKLLTPARAREILAICGQVVGGSSGRSAYLQYPK